MGTFARSLLLSIRRNPVLNAFVLAIAVQFLQDWQADSIDKEHIAGYMVNLILGVAARRLVTPNQTAEIERARSFAAGLEVGRSKRGINE